ncbi:MAG: hypothetical protein SV253_06410 [Halobacteria archaeon]|nr:hypothetical protein [Halobacteria archaeon]
MSGRDSNSDEADSDDEKSREEKLEEMMGGEDAMAQMLGAMGGMGGGMMGGRGRGGGDDDRTAMEVRGLAKEVEELRNEMMQTRKAIERIADSLEDDE